jgi:hypothetical protein
MSAISLRSGPTLGLLAIESPAGAIALVMTVVRPAFYNRRHPRGVLAARPAARHHPCRGTARPRCLTGVSVHAAALAVLAEWHPLGGPRRRVPAAQGDTTTDKSGRVVLRAEPRESPRVAQWSAPRRPRGQAAARDRARIARRRTPSDPQHSGDHRRLPEARRRHRLTGRRLWARRGSLTLRTPSPESSESGLT